MLLNRINAFAVCCHFSIPLLARETSSGNRSIYKFTRERVDSKGLCGRWRIHLMGSWFKAMYFDNDANIMYFMDPRQQQSNHDQHPCLHQRNIWNFQGLARWSVGLYYSYLLQLNFKKGRWRWVGAWNSHTKPMSRHFYRLIYFRNLFFCKRKQFQSSNTVTSISFLWLVMALPREFHFLGNSI